MRRNKVIEQIENEHMQQEIPEFGPGDTVVVKVLVREGNREREQAYEGVVIAKRNRGLNSSFTVRKISHGVGVERSFQSHSPLIKKHPRSSVVGTFVKPSSITYASDPGVQRVSRRKSSDWWSHLR